MLFNQEYLRCTCPGLIILLLILFICARYAYRVNARRLEDDPRKHDFNVRGIFFICLMWPILIAALIAVFILRALLYGTFLILFTVALLIIRKPFLLVWLDKIATNIGTKLLEVHTFLINAFFGRTIKPPSSS